MKTVLGLARASHPFPLAMVLLLTALVAVTSANGSPDAGRLALLLVAMLFSQLSIGWSNDYVDRHADAQHQPSKPIPSGLVDARVVPPAIGLAVVVTGLAGAVLGLVPLLLLAAGTCCGLAYNLGLKRTRLSALPFIAAFAVLPLFVWAALDQFRGDFLALYAIGLPLPIAVHVANVLPDLDSDRAQGRRTIAVALGRRKAVATVLACQSLALVLTAISLPWLAYDAIVLGAAAGACALLVLAAGAAYPANPDRGKEVWAFRLVVIASIVFAAGWLTAV